MGRVWMITGAGRGLGRAFTEETVRNGDQVIATVRKINPADDLLTNENVLTAIMDVTKQDEVKAAVEAGLQKFGRIDVLINNAGFGMDEGGVVEVINLKDEPKIVSNRVDGKNAFPAYHMNKQHWYTLFLDERLSDEEIVGLIEKSYALVNQ